MSTVREQLYARLTPCVDPACDCAGCLLWPGSTNGDYGLIRVDGARKLVHRVAWALDNGPIPPGLTIDHVKARGCRHTNCANVAHLEPVTPRVNVLRGDTIVAALAARTHCTRGHLYDEVNTRQRRDGGRRCRACRREGHRLAPSPSPKTT